MTGKIGNWIPTKGEKYTWENMDHYVRILPTDSRKPRGSKTVWLIEKKRIGSKSVRLAYADTYDGAIKAVTPWMRKN